MSKIDTVTLLASFHTAKDAIKFLKQNSVDLVFLDINMPNMSGLEMLNELPLKPQVIFTTAYAEFVKLIDTAAGKGLYHSNTAARKKSRLHKKLASLS